MAYWRDAQYQTNSSTEALDGPTLGLEDDDEPLRHNTAAYAWFDSEAGGGGAAP